MDVSQYRLPVHFDPARLRADLAVADSSAWSQHFHPRDYQGDWCGVALRSTSGRVNDLHAHPVPPQHYQATPLLAHCPYFRSVLAELGLTLRGVRLLSLGPDSTIRPHRDRGLAYRYGELRLHIPIITGNAVVFMVAGERVDMAPGECWYLDLDQEHSVHNAGAERRVHLVLDGVRDARSDQLLTAAGMGPREVVAPLDESTQRQVIAELQRRDDQSSRALAASMLASLQSCSSISTPDSPQ